ncbi:MAG: cytochrome P450 [Acidimicrobiia bacterium]
MEAPSGRYAEMAERELTTTDPYPEWAVGRAAGVEVVDDGGGGRHVSIFCRSDTEYVLRRSDVFSSRQLQASIGTFMGPVMLGMDGDQHTTYRKLVSPAFRASALARWEEQLLLPILNDLLDGLAPRGRAEIVGDLTSKYATRVIAGVMGVPAEDAEQIHRWAIEITAGPFSPDVGHAAAAAMREYLRPLVEERKRRPRDDLLSDIVHAAVGGARLDDEHIYGFLRLLMPAGAETTYRMLGITLLVLLQRPDWVARVRADRSLIPRVVEETLRWDSSAPLAERVAVEDTEIAGCPVPAGTRVSLTMASANRDETVYDRADEWDPGREVNPPHIAFGVGRHLCLGMHLARLELRVGLNAILDRLANLRLDPDEPDPVVRGVAFRGPDRLSVLFDPE